MTDTANLLAIALVVQSVVVAALCATVPALWWVHLREAGKLEVTRAQLAEARADVAKLDEVVDRLCRAAGLNEVKQ